MKKFFYILAVIISFTGLSARASEKTPHFVIGGIEMGGFFSAGFGWQRFAGGPPTEIANDGSYAGVLGSVIPEATVGGVPVEGEDNVEAFMEVFELDITKNFDDRASIVTKLLFGRPQSGSWVANGVDIEEAYATAVLQQSHNVQLSIGRIGTEAGFEEFEPYNNDAISWSIISRANMYPAIITGIQLSADITDNLTFYVAAANSLTDDTNVKVNEIPSGMATLEYTWGEEDTESSIILTPFVGPESDSNRGLTFGFDATLSVFVSDNFLLGFEGLYRRDDGAGGPDTDYAAAMLDLHWDMTERFYTFLKYSYANQFDDGNGYFNLTGAKQQIHEGSLGFGFWVADNMKLKFEARCDAVLPSVGEKQWVPGVALGLTAAY